MSIEKIIEALRTAYESDDWDLIKELIETLSYEGESDKDDFKEYLEDFDDRYGGDLEIDWYWLVFKCSRV